MIDERQRHELHALFAMLGRALGLEALPLPSGERERFMDVDEAMEALANPQSAVPAPLRLEVLAQMMYARRTRSDVSFSDEDIVRLADSLMLEEYRTTSDRDSLLDRLSRWRPGEEPLGRSTVYALETDALVAKLDLSVQSVAMLFLPQCEARTSSVGGIPALSIATEAIVGKPLEQFETIVNPLEWPNCWLQEDFFRSMKPVGTPAPAPVFDRDAPGWKEILLEVVDFGALSPSNTDQTMSTELEFVYFFPDDKSPAGPYARGGCTYDLHRSVDDKIQVDQGYLLVEDRKPAADVRRYRTLKTVHFRDGDQPPANVCAFWSLAIGMILQGC